MTRLVYIGKHATALVRQNPRAFEAGLRAKYPRLGETAIAAITEAAKNQTPPRHAREIYHLIGRDILTEDVTTIPVWALMSNIERDRAYDIKLGAPRPLSMRERLIEPELNLSRTYVFREENGFEQDVADADVEVIRKHEIVRKFFCRTDDVGIWTPTAAWSLPVLTSTPFSSVAEFRLFEREQQRTKQWTGV